MVILGGTDHWDRQRSATSAWVRSRPVSVCAVVATVCFVAWNQAFATGGRSSQIVGDCFPVVLALVGAWSAAGAARRTRAHGDPTGRAWVFYAAALGFRAFGEGTWAWLELVARSAPFPSVADVGYVLFYPAVLIGFVVLPLGARSSRERLRNGIDLAIVMIGGTVAVWYFVLGPQMRDLDTMSAAVVLNIVYPLGDLLLVFALASASSRQRPKDPATARATGLLVAAVGAFVVGDVVFGHLSLQDRYDGTGWADSAWAVGLCLFAVAGDLQRSWMAHSATGSYGGAALERRDRSPIVPYVAVAVSATLLVGVVARDTFYPTVGVVVSAAAIMVLVSARQAAALRDNRLLLAAYKRIASTDHLTLLGSRTSFSDSAAEALRRCSADGVGACLLMIDIDHFKSINDTYGHGAGDLALAHVAELLRANTRDDDVLLGRYGGDEMAALLFAADAEAGRCVATRLIDAVAASTFDPGGVDGPLRLSISVGYASTTPEHHDLAQLLARADGALYAAKRAGRNRAEGAPIDAMTR